MSAPVRLQLRRTKGFDLQALSHATNGLDAVKVTRPGPFGNPWSVREAADVWDCRAESAHHHVVEWFADWISTPNVSEKLSDLGAYGPTRDRHAALLARLGELRGKNLACFCRPDFACHADVLLKLANAPLCEAVS